MNIIYRASKYWNIKQLYLICNALAYASVEPYSVIGGGNYQFLYQGKHSKCLSFQISALSNRTLN